MADRSFGCLIVKHVAIHCEGVGAFFQKLGLDRAVLSNLVQQSLLDQEAERLGLFISDDSVRALIQKDKTFFNDKGIFDSKKFQELLANNHMSEAKFVGTLKQDMTRAQLVETFKVPVEVPATMAEPIYSWQNETRTIQYASFPFTGNDSAKGPIADNAVLKEYYEKHPSQFKTPETRDLSLVMVVKPKEGTTDAAYELSKKLEDELAGGASLEEASKKLNLQFFTLKNVGINATTFDGLKGKTLEKVLRIGFETSEGTESSLAEGDEGEYFIVRTDKVIPEGVEPFEKAQMKAQTLWQKQQAQENAKKKSETLAAELKANVDIKSKAFTLGASVQTIADQKRSQGKDKNAVLPGEMTNKLFFSPLNTPIVGKTKDAYLVAIATAKTPGDAKSNPEEFKALRKRMEQAVMSDVLDSYLASLEVRFPVSINDKTLNAIMKHIAGE
jgi:peptidyl-prolyl cis-trans isomerase D